MRSRNMALCFWELCQWELWSGDGGDEPVFSNFYFRKEVIGKFSFSRKTWWKTTEVTKYEMQLWKFLRVIAVVDCSDDETFSRKEKTWTLNSHTRENRDIPLTYVAAFEERTFFSTRRKWELLFCFRSP